MQFKKFCTGAVGLAAALTLALGTAAQAAPVIRLYADKNYGINFASYYSTGDFNFSTPYNDRLSSFKNQSNWDAALYEDGGQRGACFTAKRYSSVPSFAWWNDDKVSSIRVGAAC